jgi:hypothetical protein
MHAASHSLATLAIAALLVTGCASPTTAIKAPPGSIQRRQLQTREFEGHAEPELLAAGLGVLQDLGFTLDHSESQLGVISASRKLTSRRDLNSKEIAKDLLWVAVLPSIMGPAMLVDAGHGVKEPQLVRVSLVTSPAKGGGGRVCTLRVTAQRMVFKDDQMLRLELVEPLDDAAFYEEFFKRLHESVRLDLQKT